MHFNGPVTEEESNNKHPFARGSVELPGESVRPRMQKMATMSGEAYGFEQLPDFMHQTANRQVLPKLKLFPSAVILFPTLDGPPESRSAKAGRSPRPLLCQLAR